MKNISEKLHLECMRRISLMDQKTADLPGPLSDLIAILRLFDERLLELERKK